MAIWSVIQGYEHHGENCAWRTCCIKGKEGQYLFHRFYVHSWTHGAGATIGSFCAGQESEPMAIVEDEKGNVVLVHADGVKFDVGKVE